jgi:hypothetical protein
VGILTKVEKKECVKKRGEREKVWRCEEGGEEEKQEEAKLKGHDA